VAIADMFLKVQGVTGESGDAEHKGEIEVVSWSWGMQASTTSIAGEQGTGRSTLTQLEVVKKVDQASPALMSYLFTNKVVGRAKLTVRKAGQTPVEYFAIVLKNARVTSVKLDSQGTDLVERVRLGFQQVTVTYTLQDPKGGPGAASEFMADAQDPV
jgi:type VI secretion system secreted protein Hcp